MPPGASVLDVGCGCGLTCLLLTERGCAAFGIDIDPQAIAFARATVPASAFAIADARTLDLGRRFAVVICSEVIEHFDDEGYEAVLERLTAHLSDAGTLLITFPSRLYLAFEPVWKLVRRLTSPGIVWDDEALHMHVNAERIRAQLESHGLSTRMSRSLFGLVTCIEARGPHASAAVADPP